MAKIKLTKEEKARIIEALNKGVEPSPDLLPKLFPGTAEKFDVQALDRAKIPTLEYSGKRSKATILAEAGAGIGAAPLQNVRCFGDIKNGGWRNGRRTRLKIWRWQHHEGSTPSSGTNKNTKRRFVEK